MVTTIQLKPETKARLDDVKLHPRETYDETLNRLLDMAFEPEPLSEESMRRIEEALEDIRADRVRPFEEYVQERGL